LPADGGGPRDSLEASPEPVRRGRRRLPLGGELALAALPTATVLAVLAFVEALTEQRLLFGSLASSAFLIYLDPGHGTNRVRALLVSHLLAAILGWATYVVLGGYGGAALALLGTIVAMIVLDVVHPPAVATAMSFAFRAGDASNVLLFLLAAAITAVLVVLQRAAVWILLRTARRARRGA